MCAERGAPRRQPAAPLLRTSEELRACRTTHPLAAALSMLRELLGAGAADDGQVFAVGDADGTLLWAEGDTEAVGRETHKMMLEHYSQTKNLLVSYSDKAYGDIRRPVTS